MMTLSDYRKMDIEKWKHEYFEEFHPLTPLTENKAASIIGCSPELLQRARYLEIAPVSHISESNKKAYYRLIHVHLWIRKMTVEYVQWLKLREAALTDQPETPPETPNEAPLEAAIVASEGK